MLKDLFNCLRIVKIIFYKKYFRAMTYIIHRTSLVIESLSHIMTKKWLKKILFISLKLYCHFDELLIIF